MKKSKFNRLTELLLFVIGAELVGVVSGLIAQMIAGGSFAEVYDSLHKPALAPKGLIFPVVWAVLYALTAAAAYLVYSSEVPAKRRAMRIYILQLAVNFVWSPLFFGFGAICPAVAVSLVLLLLVVIMTANFAGIRTSAALLTVPYLLWTAYAAYLTAAFCALNRN